MRHESGAARKLDADEIRSLLTGTRAGRLITFDPAKDETYVVPVNFVLLSHSIYFYTEPGRKLAVLEAAPHNVALEIDQMDKDAAWSVLATRRRGDRVADAPAVEVGDDVLPAAARDGPRRPWGCPCPRR